uniref:Chemokine interleukin-8-like domain-containing protein n=1 Tax=Chrysolophus pictus TaxID=9089 RepID=A0A8C3L3K1_CHRPC
MFPPLAPLNQVISNAPFNLNCPLVLCSLLPARLPKLTPHSCCLSLPLPVGPDVPTCCTSYIKHKIPRNLIRSHYSTSTSCSQPAIIFVTKKREVCANPSDPWVQSYLRSARRD